MSILVEKIKNRLNLTEAVLEDKPGLVGKTYDLKTDSFIGNVKIEKLYRVLGDKYTYVITYEGKRNSQKNSKIRLKLTMGSFIDVVYDDKSDKIVKLIGVQGRDPKTLEDYFKEYGPKSLDDTY